MILYENDITDYLCIPAIPKRKWDGKKGFSKGCAVLNLSNGYNSYAVAKFDPIVDTVPRIVKTFSADQFVGYGDIYVVPHYMETDVENMDLDDDSKEMARLLVDEADELVGEADEQPIFEPENEYYFDNIHDDQQAIAFIRAYNKASKKGGRLPKTHEGIIMKLSVMYADEQNKKNVL